MTPDSSSSELVPADDAQSVLDGVNRQMIGRTKIVATIGPASSTPEVLRQLIEAGASVFRLNFSHGTHEGHSTVVSHIRT